MASQDQKLMRSAWKEAIAFDGRQRFREIRTPTLVISGSNDGAAPIEGAVFALFGLLLAFTFCGAVARYDAHRQLVFEERNDIGTAYLRLDLLRPQDQPPLRQLFRDYLDSRLNLYASSTGGRVSQTSDRLQQEIWQKSVVAAATPGAYPDATKLLLPALNTMFDITSTRESAFNLHPPAIIFLLLFVLSGVPPSWLATA